MTWRELEAALARGCRTAVVALGSIEQHGPHLPLATDAWIADALLERVCARLDDAIAVPTVPVGCASEHLDFPGTLDLREATLSMLLTDVLASLGRHGFERAFVFSAHGGNCAPLARAAPALAAACAPLELVVFTDLEALTAALQEAGSAAGVGPAAAGHHAGELETSILLALRPHAVRTAELAPGLAAPAADAQALFYPSLRANAPRGARYLDVWADVLVDAYRGAKKRTHANGTQKA
jgi:creatinine amidohydrolase